MGPATTPPGSPAGQGVRPFRLGLRCDATASVGVGHVMRCLALGDEVRARGGRVVLFGSVEVPWLHQVVAERGIETVPAPPGPDELAALAQARALDAMVLDGYALPAGTGRALREAGLAVLSLVDADFGAGQSADIYLDQNFRAQGIAEPGSAAVSLAGLRYALFRDEVLAHRSTTPGPAPPSTGPLRVLMVFGGTDPYRAAPVLLPLVLATGLALDVHVVAADPQVAAELEAVPTAPGQRVQVQTQVGDLGALAVRCDAAVTAAGSSVWELLCLGVPAAVVCVVDNQEPGYRSTTEAGLVVPAGSLTALRHDAQARARSERNLHRLLTDSAYRQHLRQAGSALVDGDGRRRVIDTLVGRLGAPLD